MKKPSTKITLTAAAVLAIVLLVVGVRAWKNRPGQVIDPLSKSSKPLMCPVHDVACTGEKVKASSCTLHVTYTAGYVEAMRDAFPLSGQELGSSYAPAPYDWKISYYCPECRKARGVWFEQQDSLYKLIDEVREMDMLGAFAVGAGGDPGRFYEISLEVKDELSRTEQLRLLRDKNANVAALGLVILSYQPKENVEHFTKLADDERKVTTLMACLAAETTLGAFARMLLSDLEARSMYIDAEVPADSAITLPESN